MPKPGSQSCAGCQFFGLEAVPEAHLGWCVRFPPTVAYNAAARNPDQYQETVWPITQADWWCGEWKQNTT